MNRLLLLTVALLSTNCGATSSAPSAQVIELNGQSCFSVANDSETRAGAEHFSLVVFERQEREWPAHSDRLWTFVTEPRGSGIEIFPQTCIPYGATPARAKLVGEVKPLLPGRIYMVVVGARPKKTSRNIAGYEAEFSVKRGTDG